MATPTCLVLAQVQCSVACLKVPCWQGEGSLFVAITNRTLNTCVPLLKIREATTLKAICKATHWGVTEYFLPVLTDPTKQKTVRSGWVFKPVLLPPA